MVVVVVVVFGGGGVVAVVVVVVLTVVDVEDVVWLRSLSFWMSMSISASLLPVSTGSGFADSTLGAWAGTGLLPVAATTPGMTTVGTPDKAESDKSRYIHRLLAPLFSLPTSNFLMPISIGRHSPIDNDNKLDFSLLLASFESSLT